MFGLVLAGPRIGRRSVATGSDSASDTSADAGRGNPASAGELLLVGLGLLIGGALLLGAMWWLVVGFTSPGLLIHQNPGAAVPLRVPVLVMSFVFGAAGLGVGLLALRRLGLHRSRRYRPEMIGFGHLSLQYCPRTQGIGRGLRSRGLVAVVACKLGH